MEKTEYCVCVESHNRPWKIDHRHYPSMDKSLWLTLGEMPELWIVAHGVCTFPVVPLQSD